MSNTGEIRDELDELEVKYRSLVWLKENMDWGLDHPSKQEYADQIEAKYPNEVDTLLCCECGVWEDGFNNGMLAAIRFIKDSYRYGIDKAHLVFPRVDAE